MNAVTILDLLANKHENDTFVPECKTGKTYYSNYSRLDAWAMVNSWTKPRYIGYEIKVSRGDFVQDVKWRNYLDYCSEFYFVSPRNVIEPSEVPADVGLMYISNNGNKLYIKKKSPMREVKPEYLVDIMKYVLMHRTKIVRSHFERTNIEFWKEYLEKENTLGILGRSVSAKLKERLDQEVIRVKEESERIRKENKNLDIVKQFCKNNDIDYTVQFMNNYVIADKLGLNEMKSFINNISLLDNSLKTIKEILKK